MISRISNSWELVKASASVLRADKELIVFPIISSIGVLLVTLSFALPFLLSGLFDSMISGESRILGYIVLFLFYLVQYFVIIFFNTALVSAAIMRLEGGDPTLQDGFRTAWNRLGTIFGYALISATVGLILRTLAERSNALGRLVISLVGLAWNLATFLAVPVLVVEDVGPIEAVKRSALLLKKSWGEQIVGNISISLIFGMLTFAVILVSILLSVLAVAADVPALIAVILVLSIPALIILGLLSSTLSGIFSAAVYQYTIGGQSSQFFPDDLIAGSFRER